MWEVNNIEISFLLNTLPNPFNKFQFKLSKLLKTHPLSNSMNTNCFPSNQSKKLSTICGRQIASMNEGIFSIVCSAYDRFLVIYLNFPCLSVAIRKKFIHARKAKQMFLISEFVFRLLRQKDSLEVMSRSSVIFARVNFETACLPLDLRIFLHLTIDPPRKS